MECQMIIGIPKWNEDSTIENAVQFQNTAILFGFHPIISYMLLPEFNFLPFSFRSSCSTWSFEDKLNAERIMKTFEHLHMAFVRDTGCCYQHHS